MIKKPHKKECALENVQSKIQKLSYIDARIESTFGNYDLCENLYE